MTDFVDGMHLPTIRAMLDLLGVDTEDNGFHYNEANNSCRVKLTWWSGKGDPHKRFAGEVEMARYACPLGHEMRPTGTVLLNDKAARALAKQAAAEQGRKIKDAAKKECANPKTRTRG